MHPSNHKGSFTCSEQNHKGNCQLIKRNAASKLNNMSCVDKRVSNRSKCDQNKHARSTPVPVASRSASLAAVWHCLPGHDAAPAGQSAAAERVFEAPALSEHAASELLPAGPSALQSYLACLHCQKTCNNQHHPL